MKSSGTQVLVIDDEEAICYAFSQFFADRGLEVAVAASGAAGLAACREQVPDVIFLDVCLPDVNGLELLDRLHALEPAPAVVVITAFGSLEIVTKALAGKAFDYLVKPLDLEQAADVLDRALASRRAEAEAKPVAAENDAGGEEPQLVGRSAAMQEVYKRIGRVAPAAATVLILGETGTGKELVARAIHRHSARRAGPFVAVNCGALPEHLVESELFGYRRGAFTGAQADRAGRFEAASGGTLFLDEVGDLPLPAQVKLLRFLDTRMVERLGSTTPMQLDVRVIAATNCDLRKAVEAGRFRSDLFYRLGVVQISLPPLRERPEDVPLLARHFLAQLSGGATPLAEDAVASLANHSWPGNVRELRNAMEHAVIVAGGGPVLAAHLPDSVRLAVPVSETAAPAAGGVAGSAAALAAAALADTPPGRVYETAVAELERRLLAGALARTGGTQSDAADLLGLHRNTLRRKLRELGLDAGGDDAAAER